MKNIIFLKYWAWLPRAVKFFIIGFSMIPASVGLLYVIPYSKSAEFFLGGWGLTAFTFLVMGVAYAIYDSWKSSKKKKEQPK